MPATAERGRDRSRGTLSVTAVFAVVGFLLASQLQSVRLNNQADASTISRLETLQELYNQEVDKSESLAEELAQTKAEPGPEERGGEAGDGGRTDGGHRPRRDGDPL